MLVLTRRLNERIVIGDDVEVCVLRVGGGRVRLGITAPDSVKIRRSEHGPQKAHRANQGDKAAT